MSAKFQIICRICNTLVHNSCGFILNTPDQANPQAPIITISLIESGKLVILSPGETDTRGSTNTLSLNFDEIVIVEFVEV